MILNVEKYLPYLADTELSDAQKVAYVTEIWDFLDGFFTHDLKKRATEKSGASADFNLQSPAPIISSEDLTTRFTQCANDNQTSRYKDRAHG